MIDSLSLVLLVCSNFQDYVWIALSSHIQRNEVSAFDHIYFEHCVCADAMLVESLRSLGFLELVNQTLPRCDMLSKQFLQLLDSFLDERLLIELDLDKFIKRHCA